MIKLQDKVEAAANILAEARRTSKVISRLPAWCEPSSLDESYAIQERLNQLMGFETVGWFCGASNPEVQKALNISSPYYARLYSGSIRKAGDAINRDEFKSITLECEFSFRLSTDIAASIDSYTEDEIAERVDSVYPSIEIVTSHLQDWKRQPGFSLIADNGTDGALVLGEPVRSWRSEDLLDTPVKLFADNECVRSGFGANAGGSPFSTFCRMINMITSAGHDLRKNQVFNTGTCTAMYDLEQQTSVRAEFGEFGSVDFSINL